MGEPVADTSQEEDQVLGYQPDILKPADGEPAQAPPLTADTTQTPAVENTPLPNTPGDAIPIRVTTSLAQGFAPLRVVLKAGVDPEPGASLDAFVWNFGDGTAGTEGALVVHEFTQAGEYYIEACARWKGETVPSGSCGGVSILVKPSANARPKAFDVAGETDQDMPTTLVLMGSDPEDQPITFRIVTGPSYGTLTATGSSNSETSDWFYTPGPGFVGLDEFEYVTSDGNLDSSAAKAVIRVNSIDTDPNNPPTVPGADPTSGVAINPTRTEGMAPVSIAFIASAPAGMMRTKGIYLWTFGDDGTQKQGAVVAHTFRSAGVFPVTLCAMGGPDGTQQLACDEVDITITAPESNTEPGTSGGSTTSGLAIKLSVSQGLAPVRIALSAAAPEGMTRTAGTYVWDFGDGTTQQQGAVVAHLYSTAGTFQATLCAIDPADGQTVLECANAVVQVNEPLNHPPSAISSSTGTSAGVPVRIVLQGSDVDSDSLQFHILTPPAHGNLDAPQQLSTGTATVNYTPVGGFAGEDSFTFGVNDGLVNSSPASIQIQVSSTPTQPGYPSRQPQWPLKASRTLVTDEQLQRVRQLVQTNTAARWARDAYVQHARQWAEMSDQALREMLPDYRVPRDTDVCAAGCPIHGTTIYQHGTYPWVLNQADPFHVTCPVGGERYPSNDFKAYYDTGMSNASLLTGDYADDGRGWVGPNGQKYWFVAYACHWHWMQTWLPAVTNLSMAYAMTGDLNYARKAVVMLDRIAEVYPGMDYAYQSRMGELRNFAYPGKIFNSIWETWEFEDLVIAYDAVFDSLVGPNAISLPWRSAEQIRANIEANLLEEGLDALFDHRIQGEYGWNQSVLAYTAIVRQQGPTTTLIDRIFSMSGGVREEEGLDYALYNLAYKDGMSFETSPGYSFNWLTALAKMDKPLRLAGRGVYDLTRVNRLLEGPVSLLCTGAFTPAIGDAGAVSSGWIGPRAEVYEDAYRALATPRDAWVLDQLGGLNVSQGYTFNDVLKESIVDQARQDSAQYAAAHRPPASRLLDGYGLAILNNANDSTAVSMYFGPRGGHGHADHLNLELFGYGRRLSPDLGYPDAMNIYVPGIASWSTNTLSHNCVMVDDQRMPGRTAGNVLRFHNGPGVHIVDVDGAQAYAQTSVYRRTLVKVDVGASDAYLVDVFRVRGGSRHVLSLHGPEAAFDLQGAALPPAVTQGTLAGADVAYGQLYDDPVLGAPNYPGPFHTYAGSGYQHLFNWQQVAPAGPVVARWQPLGTPAAQLRVHVPPEAGQDLVVADAYVSPLRKINTILKYMLVRRAAGAEGNTFVVVWEIAGAQPIVNSVTRLAVQNDASGSDATVALSVQRGTTTDVVIVSATPGQSRVVTGAGSNLTSNASVALLSTQAGQTIRALAVGGSTLTSASPSAALSVPTTCRGTISSIDYGNRALTVVASQVPTDLASLAGTKVRIHNSLHTSMYTIGSATPVAGGFRLTLVDSDIFTGRLHIASVNPTSLTLTTDSTTMEQSRFHGMWVVSDNFQLTARIESVTRSTFQLADVASTRAMLTALNGDPDGRVWVTDFGPGDSIEIERLAYQAW